MTSVWGGSSVELEPWLHLARPVAVRGCVVAHPVLDDDQYRVRFRVETLRQGARVQPRELGLWLSLPAAASAPTLDSCWRLRGYLTLSTTYANDPTLASRPRSWRLRIKSVRFAELERPPGRFARFAAALRSRLTERLDAAGSHRRAPALVRALVLGDSSRLPKLWQQTLRRSGLGHLLAISGLHVGLLALWLALVTAPLPVKVRLAVAAAGILLYLLLVGPRPSILRASAMGLLATLALCAERPPQVWNNLATGVLLLVLWDPALAHDLGFRLSVAATAGVVAAASAARRRGWLVRAVLVSLAAQVATLPIILPVTAAVHPGALFLNLVAIPWLAVVLIAAFLWLAASALSDSLESLPLTVLEMAVTPLDGLAALPPSALWSYGVGAAWGVSWFVPLAFFGGLRWPRRIPPAALILLALWVNEAGGSGVREPVDLIFFDVGQGDATLVRDGRHAVLVDGGGWPRGDLGGRVLAPALAAVGVRHLDAVVLTHPDIDHCHGLVDVARYLPVDELWMAPGWTGDPCADELLASPGLRWRPLWRGRRVRVGRWRLTVLHPGAEGGRGRNDASLVLLADVFGRRSLLTGDAESRTEEALATRYRDLRADVLKVGHHGSRTSTTERLLDAVRPALAVISAGSSNPYGHPHPTVSQRLRDRSIVVLRTDRAGRVRLRFHPSGRIAAELPAVMKKRSTGHDRGP